MSDEVNNVAASKSVSKASARKHKSILDRVLRLLSSVRFGITMLVIVLICSIIGMLIMQVEVEGFQECYERLTPAQRAIYEQLGFFDIYHSWYFALLLAVTGLNIILASIDRFPTAWRYISKPSLQAIDSLLYRTVGVAFPLLSLLLITGPSGRTSPGAGIGDGTLKRQGRL